jgi:hypothetical protein
MAEDKMNKTDVCARPGWTDSRAKRFLLVEQEHYRRCQYGSYMEYEYSLAQVLEAEKSDLWRQQAAKYLKVPVSDLDAAIAARIAAVAIAKAEAAAHEEIQAAECRKEWEQKQVERKALAATMRGGLCRLGMPDPLSDGWRTFTTPEVMEYVDFADRRGRIDAEYITEFYRLWADGAGYCNPKGVLRKLIAPVKQRIMRILIYMAQREAWSYGVSAGRILYVDTPLGQVSFHLRPWERSGLPTYTQSWSGLRDSDTILAALFDAFQRRALPQPDPVLIAA